MKKLFFDQKILTGISDYIIYNVISYNNLMILFDDSLDMLSFKDIFVEYKDLVLKYQLLNLKEDFEVFFIVKDNGNLSYESIIDLYNFNKMPKYDKKICIFTNSFSLDVEIPLDLETIEIIHNNEIDLEKLIYMLIKFGYKNVEYVEMLGEFAVRGNILDIWSNSIIYKNGLNEKYYRQPVRIILDENRVENIKFLNPSTQRSISEDIFKVVIFPINFINLSSKKIKLKETFKEYKNFIFFGLENCDYLEGYYPNKKYYGNTEMFIRDIKNFISEDYKIVIGYTNEYQKAHIEELLKKNGIFPIKLAKTSLTSGFYNINRKFLFITFNEIFLKFQLSTLVKSPKIYESLRLENIWEIQPGDYVVHFEYGIAKFLGTKKITIREITKEFLVLEFKDNAILYVSVVDINQVEKYISVKGKQPTLSSLSKESWEKTKKRIKDSLKEFIIELYNVYSQRKKLKGYKFTTDQELEKALAESFEYEETEDQLKAINDVYKDMSSDYPMDRIIVGDVGFGKTEVALRATFRAVINAKQVAMLCPTTVLAHQHYITFSRRLEPFGVKVEVLSRLKTKTEIKKILEDLRSGKIDVIIGTHLLLKDDVEFFDLGVLIIDEEHKFGVKQKEKIRLKYNSFKNSSDKIIPDVLYLTATPIPRTLASGLQGIKDISIIESPPQGRKPIETFVLPYNEETVIYAITKELQRNGQVYYIYNDIKTIENKVEKIKKYFGETKIEFIHSKLPEKKIEDIMIKFLNNQIQILVSTTIIESGLDIPEVNTIIVEEAHKFGLAQLYQLRGRVGRRDKKAYCYFFYSKDNLTSDAKKRLSALMEFTSLGSGYYLALRDLEIRGAGEILGTRQHGFINEIGLNMYSKFIQELLYEIKTNEKYEDFIPSIDMEINAYIPKEYIKDETTRITFYRKLLSAESYNEIDNIKEEIYDRFGKISQQQNQPLENLFYLSYLKILMKKFKIRKIYEENNKEYKNIFLIFGSNNKILKKFHENLKDIACYIEPDKICVKFKKESFSVESILEKLLEVEKKLTSEMNT
ncbi:MAG: DEAD/DEAH box helicase [Endomicrobiia bacterium]